MKFRSLDANGDWMYGQGVGSYATGKAAIALAIATRLRLWRGECAFSTASGVDYTNLLDKGQEANLATALQNAILQTPGVVKIVSMPFSLNPRTRAMSVGPVTVETIYGQVFLAQINDLIGGSSSA